VPKLMNSSIEGELKTTFSIRISPWPAVTRLQGNGQAAHSRWLPITAPMLGVAVLPLALLLLPTLSKNGNP
jgi:hypothetical protein